MENKILEILLDIQKENRELKNEFKDFKTELKDFKTEFKELKTEVKELSKKVDKIEYQMRDGFETLELLSEANRNDINKLGIRLSKLEKRVLEMQCAN